MTNRCLYTSEVVKGELRKEESVLVIKKRTREGTEQTGKELQVVTMKMSEGTVQGYYNLIYKSANHF